MKDSLVIGDRSFSSRLFTGTGKFSSGETMSACLAASGTELVTVALKRVRFQGERDSILDHLNLERFQVVQLRRLRHLYRHLAFDLCLRNQVFI